MKSIYRWFTMIHSVIIKYFSFDSLVIQHCSDRYRLCSTENSKPLNIQKSLVKLSVCVDFGTHFMVEKVWTVSFQLMIMNFHWNPSTEWRKNKIYIRTVVHVSSLYPQAMMVYLSFFSGWLRDSEHRQTLNRVNSSSNCVIRMNEMDHVTVDGSSKSKMTNICFPSLHLYFFLFSKWDFNSFLDKINISKHLYDFFENNREKKGPKMIFYLFFKTHIVYFIGA